jgi:hypothetical protein
MRFARARAAVVAALFAVFAILATIGVVHGRARLLSLLLTPPFLIICAVVVVSTSRTLRQAWNAVTITHQPAAVVGVGGTSRVLRVLLRHAYFGPWVRLEIGGRRTRRLEVRRHAGLHLLHGAQADVVIVAGEALCFVADMRTVWFWGPKTLDLEPGPAGPTPPARRSAAVSQTPLPDVAAEEDSTTWPRRWRPRPR